MMPLNNHRHRSSAELPSPPSTVGPRPASALLSTVEPEQHHTHRSAMSTCWCVVESVLSTIVLVYVVKGAGETITDMRTGGLDLRELCNLSVGSIFGSLLWILLPLNALVCTGCAVWCAAWTGASHSLCTRRVEAAVDKIALASDGRIDRPGRRRRRWPCSLNVFEYHDVMTTGLQISKVVIVWVLFQAFFVMPVVGVLAQFLSYSNDAWSALHVLTLFWTILYVFLFAFSACGAAVVIFKSGDELRAQPFHLHTRLVLLVSTVVFLVLLCFAPAPSTWRGTLIAIHTVRVSNVFTSLLGHIGMVDGIDEEGEGGLL